MSYRLLIIQPSYYRSPADRSVFRTRRRSLVPLTLPYLAALTPAGWEITLLDEQLQAIDFACRPDLVAITSGTLNSLRAYDIADEFRRRGVPVIMGGPHTFFHAEEAAEHCSAVGIGEGEAIWPRMLADAVDGRLEKSLPRRPASQPRRPAAAPLRPGGPAPLWPVQDVCRGLVTWLSFSLRLLFRTVPAGGALSVSARVGSRRRKSSIATPGISSSATAISAASGPTRWSLWRR